MKLSIFSSFKYFFLFKGVLMARHYDNHAFVTLLLSKRYHKLLLKEYLYQGFTTEDFVFYQKTLVTGNTQTHVEFPPSISNELFKINVQDEIDTLTDLGEENMFKEERELKILLGQLKRLL